MKTCQKCNKEYQDEDSFCDECGSKLKKKEEKKEEIKEKPAKEYKSEKKEGVVHVEIPVGKFKIITTKILMLLQITLGIICIVVGATSYEGIRYLGELRFSTPHLLLVLSGPSLVILGLYGLLFKKQKDKKNEMS